MSDGKNPRIIKRYANRKLYDMSESCYITHDEIAALVEAGEEVRIIDNRTKEDLTTITLTQILFEKEKKQRRSLPLATLRNLFQSSGDFIDKHITQPVTNLRAEAEETVRKVFRQRGEDAKDEPEAAPEAAREPAGEPAADKAAGEDAGERPKAAEAMREWFTDTQKSFENMQKMLEERWNLVVHSLGHFDINHKRISLLEKRVRELEERLGVQPGEALTGEAAEASPSAEVEA